MSNLISFGIVALLVGIIMLPTVLDMYLSEPVVEEELPDLR